MKENPMHTAHNALTKRVLALLLAAASLFAFAAPALAAVATEDQPTWQSAQTQDVQIVYDPASALIEQTGGDPEAMQAAIDKANAAPGQSGFTSDMPQVPFVVDIIDKNTTVVIVVDEKRQPLSGASVKITNKDGNVKSGSADGEGKVRFKMNELGKEPFYSRIEVSKGGYRTFITQEMRFSGGAFRYIALTKDNGQPYFSQMDFDNWDFQYAKNNLQLCKKNDAQHTFTFKTEGLKSGQTATVRLIAKGSSSKEMSRGVTGSVTPVKLEGEWCNPSAVSGNSNVPFTNGQVVTAVIETGGKTYSYKTNMRVENTVLDAPIEAKIDMTGFGSANLKDIQLPESALPVVRGAFGNMPVSGFEVFILPSGRTYVGINMELDKKFKDRLKQWKTTPECKYEDWEADNSKLFKAMKAAFENKAIDYKNPANNFMKCSIGAVNLRYDVDFYSRAFLVGRYDPKSKTAAGEMTYMGGSNLKLRMSMSYPFKVFTIIIGFDALLNPELSYVSQIKNIDPAVTRQTKAQIVPTGDVMFAVKAEVGISGSAGIPDVATAGARGFMFIQPRFQITPKQPVTQRDITLGIGIQLKAEIAMFTFTKRLWGKNWTYDNKSGTWKSKAWWFDTPQDAVADLPQEGYAAEELTTEQLMAVYQDALDTDPFADEGEWNATSPAALAALCELDQNSAPLQSKYVNEEVQSLTAEELSHPVAADYGERNRIMPKKTTKIASDVYSDAKIRVVPVGKQGYLLFRIVMANINGKAAARLAYSQKTSSGWSTPQILRATDASCGYTEEYSDYSFDIFTIVLGTYYKVALVSGKGANRTPETAFKDTALFTIEVRNSASSTSVTMKRVADSSTNAAFPYISTAYISLACIVYAAQEKPGIADTGKNAVFLCIKDETDKTLKIGESTSRILSVCGGVINKGGTQQDPKQAIFAGYLEAGAGSNTLTAWERPCNRNGEWTGEAKTKKELGVSSIAMPRVFIAMPESLYYIQNEALYRMYGLDVVVKEKVKLSSGAKLCTCTDGMVAAEVLCWFENVEGQDENGKKVEDYTLHMFSMALKSQKGQNEVRSPGYVFSNLAHAVDSGTVYCIDPRSERKQYGVVYTHTTDAAGQKADLYDAELKNVRSIDLLGMSSADPCVVSGQFTDVSLQAKNLGNLPVDKFKVNVYADEAKSRLLTSFDVDCSTGKRPADSDIPDERLKKYILPEETMYFTAKMQVTSGMGTGTKKLYAFVADNSVQACKPVADKDARGYSIVESDGKMVIAYSDGYVNDEATIGSDGAVLEAYFNSNTDIFAGDITYDSILPENEVDCPQVSDITPSDFGFGHDDLELTHTTQMIGGEEYVSLRVFNDATLGSDALDGSLGAQIQLKAEIDGRTVSLGLLYLKRGEGATITLPLDGLTGGKRYDYILFSAETGDEFNQVDNTTMIGYYPAPAGAAGGGISGYTSYSGMEYTFLENGIWQRDGGLRFAVDAPCAHFASVLVDGVVVEKQNYTMVCGSTVVILHKDYLATLGEGVHTLRVQFTDGRADTSFFATQGRLTVDAVAEIPATGGNGMGAFALLLLACVLTAWRKRRAA